MTNTLRTGERVHMWWCSGERHKCLLDELIEEATAVSGLSGKAIILDHAVGGRLGS